MAAQRIKLMIVDDSAVMRQTLSQIFASDAELEVIGAHSNPIFAMNAMQQLWPDVIVLDVEMPGMDGITFLKTLMKTNPLPVIICSSLTVDGAATTLEALQAGAIEIIAKPLGGLKAHFASMAHEMVRAVKSAARANVRGSLRISSGVIDGAVKEGLLKNAQQQLQAVAGKAMSETTDRIIAIGTSTGGTQALDYLVQQLPITVPGIVVVQHMPEAFTKAFAERLDKCSVVTVKEAEDNERILPGHVYIARGGRHLEIRRQGAYYYSVVKDGAPVSRHKPSVNVLFSSVATHAGKNAFGFILTGMGDDGARGLLEMRNVGARTYAQDEASCVVFGMPKEAIKLGAVQQTESLSDLAKLMAAIKG